MGLFSKKPQTSTSTTTTNPWGPAGPILENILNQADKLFNEQGGINAEWINKEIADLNPEMQETIKNLVNSQQFTDIAKQFQNMANVGQVNAGTAGDILTNLAQGGGAITTEQIGNMAKDLYQGDLVQSQKEQLGKDVGEQLGKAVQGINQGAAKSGGMGSSRAGVMEGVATGKAADAIASGNASIENNAINNAINQAMNIAQGNLSSQQNAAGSLGQLGMGQFGQLGNAGNALQQGINNQLTGSSILQNFQQGILNNNWMNAMGQQQMGWDQLNKLLGITGAIGGMGGTSTTTGTVSGGKGGGLGGLLSGAGGLMSGIGAMGGLFSDERLKDDINTVIEALCTVDGTVIIPRIVQWTWNDTARALAEEKGVELPISFGVIAQEVEATPAKEFVHFIDTEVEGLDGKVRIVDYDSLIQYANGFFKSLSIVENKECEGE